MSVDLGAVPDIVAFDSTPVRPPVSSSALTAPAWKVPTRFVFRLCVAYFGMYVLFTQMLSSMLPVGWLPRFGVIAPMRPIVLWTAKHVFRVDRDLILFSGSGDKTYDWVQALCMLTTAIAIAVAWSIADRRRRAYPRLHQWFHLFTRFALGATLVSYGASKVVPLQMPFPPLLRLIEPYGNFSPMGVLWYSIGASRPYEMFTGSVELLAGLLLFVPRTSLLGALVALAATVQIFMLNMTYDVPVKLFSLHLILMSLFLIAPDLPRLIAVLFSSRAIPPPARPDVVRRVWTRRAVLGLQLALGAYLLVINVSQGIRSWYLYGGGAAKPPLYGIWMVDEMTLDGRTRPPLLTDAARWRRVIVQSATTVTFQHMDETLQTMPGKIDLEGRRLNITRGQSAETRGAFSWDQPSPTSLLLDGELDGHKMRLQLTLFDLQKFLLMTRGFNWIQEAPFNR